MGLRAAYPVLVSEQLAVFCIDTVHALSEDLIRSPVRSEVLDGEARGHLCEVLADIHAEGNEYGLLRREITVLLEHLDTFVHAGTLVLRGRGLLDFEHHLGLRRLAGLYKIVSEGRNRLPVHETVVFEDLVVVLVYPLLLSINLYGAVVEDEQHPILCHIDIELRAPESVFLGCRKGCDGVLCVLSLLAVPIAAMGHDLHLVGLCPFLGNGGRDHHHCRHHYKNKLLHFAI